ncbi:MAG: hypothetical protein ABIP35_03430 [Ginsengibacter sp.]
MAKTRAIGSTRFVTTDFNPLIKKYHFSLKRAVGSGHISNYKNQNRKMVRAYGSLAILLSSPTD